MNFLNQYLVILANNFIDKPWATLFGVAGSLLILSGLLVRSPIRLKFQLGLGTACQAIHFILLGSPSAAAISASITLRTWLTIFTKTKKAKVCLFLFFSVWFCCTTWYTWQDYRSLFPMLAAINSTAAFAFFSNNGMRYMLIGSAGLWIATGLLWGSASIIAQELISVTLNAIGIWKINHHKSQENLDLAISQDQAEHSAQHNEKK